jgi:PBP1b-binding outer membrane lipoprotein LpoB
MKKKILSIIMISVLVLSGCAGKPTNTNNKSGTDTSSKAASVSQSSTTERVEVKTDFKEIKPGTTPQLSAKQKAEVSTKIGTTITDLSKVLNSIQDAQDIDLNSVN